MGTGAVRAIDAAERRARLGRRHSLAAGAQAPDVVEAASRMVCLHGTDLATVYLSAWARVPGMTVGDMDHALYVERSLVKHMAMRRTLFVFPRAALPFAQAGASTRVAQTERRRLIRDVESCGLHQDGERWLDEARAVTLAALADGREATMAQLRTELAELAGSMPYAEGRSWGGQIPVGPRVLTVLSAEGRILRGTNDGPWRTSRPRWTSAAAWLGEPIPPLDDAEGERRLVEMWLRAFGPGTTADLRWWLGSTLTRVRAALRSLDAVQVDLDGTAGWVLPDDVDPVEPPPPWSALLPGLDPTTMGWTERAWYLGPYRTELFDSNGNAGPTAWWDGRIVGGWAQDAQGRVVLQLLEEVPRAARMALAGDADRLTEWFAGTRVLPTFPSPLAKSLASSAAGPVEGVRP